MAKIKDNRRNGVRSNNGVPFELYLELLIVADTTIYEDHKVYAQSTDENLVLIHMRAYFIHYVNGINQRYVNSFTTDPDMRITVKRSGLILQTVCYKNFK